MNQSFNSWKKLTEALATGREVMLDPITGKRHKVTYRVQTNNKFVMKVINDADILDPSQKLTPQGIDTLIKYFNEETPFTQAIGELNPDFFSKKFIVYTVLSDGMLFGRTKQKIQFEVVERSSGVEGMPGYTKTYPNIPDTVQFIDADTFNSLSQLAMPIVSQLKQDAKAADLPDPKVTQDDSKPEAPIKKEEHQETKKELGKRFLYTMRTNSKLYMMEFMNDGNISAKTEDGSDPNGIVSYNKAAKKVMWNTTLDDATSQESRVQSNVGTPLFTDSEITNHQDKTFLEKMFTDEAFRRKIIEEYEKTYGGSELTPENLRKMLFYKDGTSIFSSESQSTQGTSAASGSGAQQVSDLSDRLNKLKAQFTGESPATT